MGYGYRRTVTVDNTKVLASLSNFRMLVKETSVSLKSVSNGGNVESEEGYDIIFASDKIGGSLLYHEIQYYDPSTGELVAWVNIPTLSGSADTEIYMLYGNDEIVSATEDPITLWGMGNHYAHVFHTEADEDYEIEGIPFGIREASSDVGWRENYWGGVGNTGELDYQDNKTLTKFDGTVLDMDPINNGIAGQDNEGTVEKYVMYSVTSVHSRFSPVPHGSNANHFILVRYSGGNWQYDNNGSWYNFTPISTDLLVARVRGGIHWVRSANGGVIRSSLDGQILYPGNTDIVNGKIRKARNFSYDGSSSWEFSSYWNPALSGMPTEDFVLEAWYRSTSTSGRLQFISIARSAQQNAMMFPYQTSSENVRIFIEGTGYNLSAPLPMGDSAFHKVVMRRRVSDGRVEVYLDGSLLTSGTISTATLGTSSPSISIGNEHDAYPVDNSGGGNYTSGEQFWGDIEEIRYSNNYDLFSPDRIETQYNSENDPSTFYEFGDEEFFGINVTQNIFTFGT